MLLRQIISVIGSSFIFLFVPVAFSQSLECPAIQEDISNVEFSLSTCREINLSDYVMSGPAVWLTISIDLTTKQIESEQPLGLFISGNMSASAYLNGNYIGGKGLASITPENEVAGAFDWVGFVDPSFVHQGANTLTLLISSHRNITSRQGYFNRLYVGEFINTTDEYNKHYALTFVPLGAMLIGLAFLLSRGFKRSSRPLLALVIIAIVQLLIEVSRGIYAYPYYLQDARLFAIALCAFFFGQCLLLVTIRNVSRFRLLLIVSASSLLTLAVQIVTEDYDYKAIVAVQIPAVLWLLWTCAQKLKLIKPSTSSHQNTYALIFLSLLLATFVTKNEFLDSFFYYLIAAIVVALTVVESKRKVTLEKELSNTKHQAEKLKMALALTYEKPADQVIKIKSAGQITLVPMDSIIFCKAAGDYVELVCKDQSVLFSGSLQRLIDELTSGFLKVHRSYIVNAKYITELKRMPSGNGELQLAQGHRVPVSRAMFIKIRETVAE